MNKVLQSIFILLLTSQVYAQNGDKITLNIDKDEYWWGGLSSRGYEMPYNVNSEVSHDMWGDNLGNQAQPLLLSSKGRYVWSETPIKYTFNKGKLSVSTQTGNIDYGKAGNNLKEAYQFACENFFSSNGKIPEELLFTNPQYNTWIELMYDQNEADILKYAQDIIDNGYPPGVLMIDDNWQEDYGTREISPRRFKDPKGMMKKPHDMGFQVMLWICPFISPDSEVFRHLAKEGMLILEPMENEDIHWTNTKNKTAIIRWWNGASACLDLSNPKTQHWFKERLNFLVDEYGVDGFKFDAGDARFYSDGVVSFKPVTTPNDHTTYFADYNECVVKRKYKRTKE